MISKYSGRCKGCGKSYDEGTDIFWTREEGPWHWSCRNPQESEPPSGEAHELADRLKFEPLSKPKGLFE